MHCPNCGTKASGDQKFCRSCGLRLDKLSQLLAEQIATTEPSFLDKQRQIERWRYGATVVAIATAVIAVLWTVIDKVILG